MILLTGISEIRKYFATYDQRWSIVQLNGVLHEIIQLLSARFITGEYKTKEWCVLNMLHNLELHDFQTRRSTNWLRFCSCYQYRGLLYKEAPIEEIDNGKEIWEPWQRKSNDQRTFTPGDFLGQLLLLNVLLQLLLSLSYLSGPYWYLASKLLIGPRIHSRPFLIELSKAIEKSWIAMFICRPSSFEV